MPQNASAVLEQRYRSVLSLVTMCTAGSASLDTLTVAHQIGTISGVIGSVPNATVNEVRINTRSVVTAGVSGGITQPIFLSANATLATFILPGPQGAASPMQWLGDIVFEQTSTIVQ